MEKWVYAFRFIGIGWYIAICIGGCIFGGVLLDRHFEKSIIFTHDSDFQGLEVDTL